MTGIKTETKEQTYIGSFDLIFWSSTYPDRIENRYSNNTGRFSDRRCQYKEKEDILKYMDEIVERYNKESYSTVCMARCTTYESGCKNKRNFMAMYSIMDGEYDSFVQRLAGMEIK